MTGFSVCLLLCVFVFMGVNTNTCFPTPCFSISLPSYLPYFHILYSHPPLFATSKVMAEGCCQHFPLPLSTSPSLPLPISTTPPSLPLPPLSRHYRSFILPPSPFPNPLPHPPLPHPVLSYREILPANNAVSIRKRRCLVTDAPRDRHMLLYRAGCGWIQVRMRLSVCSFVCALFTRLAHYSVLNHGLIFVSSVFGMSSKG